MEKTLSMKDNFLFRASYRRGKQKACKTMVVYVMRDRQKTVNRLGITVSVKLGCAVARNRMRRRLREAYRLIEPSLKTGYCIVLVARHASLDADFALLESEMLTALRELGAA